MTHQSKRNMALLLHHRRIKTERTDEKLVVGDMVIIYNLFRQFYSPVANLIWQFTEKNPNSVLIMFRSCSLFSKHCLCFLMKSIPFAFWGNAQIMKNSMPCFHCTHSMRTHTHECAAKISYSLMTGCHTPCFHCFLPSRQFDKKHAHTHKQAVNLSSSSMTGCHPAVTTKSLTQSDYTRQEEGKHDRKKANETNRAGGKERDEKKRQRRK